MLISKHPKKAQLGIQDVEIKKEETVWNGFFKMYKFCLRHKLFSGEWSQEMSRELFNRGEAAAAVVYDPKRDLVGLIEQFRIGAIDSAFGPWCLEVVAGMVEAGEEYEDLIRRELEEEAGIKDAELIHISSYYSTPGGCNEKIHLYCALADLSEAGGLFGLADENEDIYFHVLEAEEVFSTMLQGRANNAATLIGLQWLQINRAHLRQA